MEPNARLSAALRHKAPTEPKPAPVASIAQNVQMSLSIFPEDLERIEEIRQALAARGHKTSTSQAVRLALRALTVDAEALEPLLLAMQKTDGRTVRHRLAKPPSE